MDFDEIAQAMAPTAKCGSMQSDDTVAADQSS